MNPTAIVPTIPDPQTDAQYVLYALLVSGLIAWALWLMLGKRKKKWNGDERRQDPNETIVEIEVVKTLLEERNHELQEFKQDTREFQKTNLEQHRELHERVDELPKTLVSLLIPIIETERKK